MDEEDDGNVRGGTSLSLFMEAYGLEVQEELSTMATYSVLGRRSMDSKVELRAKTSPDEADSRGSDVKTSERAGAVMCETRDLVTKWPHWDTLMFSDEIKVDMRFVCPKDVRKMLAQRSR